MTPSFVKKVWAKRRKEAEARRTQLAKEAEKNQRSQAYEKTIVAKYRTVAMMQDEDFASELPTGKEIIKDVCDRHGMSVAYVVVVAGAAWWRSGSWQWPSLPDAARLQPASDRQVPASKDRSIYGADERCRRALRDQR